jgi:hypothetical protein
MFAPHTDGEGPGYVEKVTHGNSKLLHNGNPVPDLK